MTKISINIADALHASYQMTKRQMKELENSSEDHRAFAWLKESNSKLRYDLKHVCDNSVDRATSVILIFFGISPDILWIG